MYVHTYIDITYGALLMYLAHDRIIVNCGVAKSYTLLFVVPVGTWNGTTASPDSVNS